MANRKTHAFGIADKTHGFVVADPPAGETFTPIHLELPQRFVRMLARRLLARISFQLRHA